MTNTVGHCDIIIHFDDLPMFCFEWSSSVIQADHGMMPPSADAQLGRNSSHYQLSKTLMFIVLSLALVCRTDTHSPILHPPTPTPPYAGACLFSCLSMEIYLCIQIIVAQSCTNSLQYLYYFRVELCNCCL